MKANNNLGFIGKLFLWINYLLCGALLLSYLAPFVDPRKGWMIAFFGLGYPLLLIANIIMIFYWLLGSKKRYILLSLTTILIGWNVLRNNIGFHSASDERYTQVQNKIRFMTYNVHNFKRYGAHNDISTKHDILKIIKDEQPDVIGFQEFYTRKRGQYDMQDSIAKIIKPGYFYVEPFTYNKDESIGMAIFSKFPIVNHGWIHLSENNDANQCLFVDVKKGDTEFRFYSVHLQSIKFDPEDYKYLNSVSKQGKPDIGSTRRLGSKLKNAFLKRSEQVSIIKKHAAECPYPYIISGDFNDTPASFAVNQMSKDLKNAFREKGYGFGKTYNGDFPNYQIDYIFASRQFNVFNYKIIEKKLSDHYPIRSDMLLK